MPPLLALSLNLFSASYSLSKLDVDSVVYIRNNQTWSKRRQKIELSFYKRRELDYGHCNHSFWSMSSG